MITEDCDILELCYFRGTFQRERYFLNAFLQHCVTFVTLPNSSLSTVVHALVLRARRKRSFSYFAVSEGRSEHGAISMIHGHDSLYYHGIEEGSHKWQGLHSRGSEQQEKIAEIATQITFTSNSCRKLCILFLLFYLESFESNAVLDC